jgi:hypothetical protein
VNMERVNDWFFLTGFSTLIYLYEFPKPL